MLNARGLGKTYEDGTNALVDLSLSVAGGEIYCLLGANGAGKSTTINIFLNFIGPSSGEAFVDELSVVKNPLECRARLAYVPENVMLYGGLTGQQNLRFFAALSGKSRTTREELAQLLTRVGLDTSCLDRRVGGFSKGMRQKLALATALLRDANNLLLDEPTSGLDPKAAFEFIRILERLRDEGKAVLMSTHDIFRAKEVGSKVGIMRAGRLVAEYTREDLRGQDLEKMYLRFMEGGEAV